MYAQKPIIGPFDVPAVQINYAPEPPNLLKKLTQKPGHVLLTAEELKIAATTLKLSIEVPIWKSCSLVT